MPIRQNILAFLVAAFIFLFILELVRKRKLKEEYSWLWLLTAAIMFLLIIRFDLLIKLTHLIGAVTPNSTLFFFAIIFLMLVCLQFSVTISKQEERIKNLTQEITLLKAHQERNKEIT